jgi:hypothetical protein
MAVPVGEPHVLNGDAAGIGIHQASLEWVRSAMAALGAAPSSG